MPSQLEVQKFIFELSQAEKDDTNHHVATEEDIADDLELIKEDDDLIFMTEDPAENTFIIQEERMIASHVIRKKNAYDKDEITKDGFNLNKIFQKRKAEPFNLADNEAIRNTVDLTGI